MRPFLLAVCQLLVGLSVATALGLAWLLWSDRRLVRKAQRVQR